MSVTPNIENLHLIRDVVTNKTFACTLNLLNVPWQWRTGIVSTTNASGGVDTRAGNRNYLMPRAITANLIHKYAPGESFKTVMNALELVLIPGNTLELTFEEEDTTIWLWEGVRCEKFDKKMANDYLHYCEMPLVFTAPDPMQRALYKSDLFYLDNGLLLDNGWYLDDDPDSFALTGSPQVHTINNSLAGQATGADEAPIVQLLGPITGPIQFSYQDDAGNILYWYYSGNIAANETVTVDAEQLDVLSTAGVYAYGNFTLGGGQESWGRIAPGMNTLTLQYAGYAAPANCHIIWTNRK